VIAGGTQSDIEKYRQVAQRLGAADRVHCIGPRPLDAMRAVFENADVLVSPRIRGDNTPMKIYSYLDSGRAVLATRLPTHTQVLDDSVALLADPEPEAFAEAMHRLATDPEQRAALADRARRLASEKYSFEAFSRVARSLYDWIENAVGQRGSGGEA
jgi:glycosyltransferase involved in cell wall biosynthesis